jgi:hypothetical protein
LGTRHRRQAVEIGLDVGEIALAQPVVEEKRKNRQVMRVVRRNAPAQRTAEICRAPAADAGCSVGGDVGRDDRAPFRGEDAAAGIRLAVVPGIGMALIAACARGQIGAARDTIRVRGARGW